MASRETPPSNKSTSNCRNMTSSICPQKFSPSSAASRPQLMQSATLPPTMVDTQLSVVIVDGELHNSDRQNQLNLPKPSFRLAQNSAYKRRAFTAQRAKKESNLTKDNYYHYIETPPEELLAQVEYDMDQEDQDWLRMFNDRHARCYNYEVSESEFEKIMDRLEKESYFEIKGSGQEPVPDEDAICAICNDGDCQSSNVILLCDMCDLPVHQDCYGVPYVPEGQWLCRRCLLSPSRNVECVLCPNKGGAFKQTDNNQWAHVICALWIPEVCFANTVFLEPIESIDRIPQARWKLICYICRQKKKGACIQCHKSNCYIPFHVTCAQQAGLYMRITTHKQNTSRGLSTSVRRKAFCDIHSMPRWRKSQTVRSASSEDEDVDSRAFKRKQRKLRDKMKKARAILEKRRELAFNPTAEPRIDRKQLYEISKLLIEHWRKKQVRNFDELRKKFIKRISAYWLMKRKQRNGVPLLRRLQVSYNKNIKTEMTAMSDLDCEKFARLRYDLEKSRLLVGEVRRRELLKRKMIKLSEEIVQKSYQAIDLSQPPAEE